MQVRVFTLQFNPLLEAFDESPLQDFVKDKEILSVREQFFVNQERPYLLLVVTYRLSSLAVIPHNTKAGGKMPQQEAEGWRKMVNADDLPLFNSLRVWRIERSRRDGIPPFVICNNRQLAEMISKRPRSLAELGQIQGIGPATLKKYGKDMLALLSSGRTETQGASEAQGETVLENTDNGDDRK